MDRPPNVRQSRILAILAPFVDDSAKNRPRTLCKRAALVESSSVRLQAKNFGKEGAAERRGYARHYRFRSDLTKIAVPRVTKTTSIRTITGKLLSRLATSAGTGDGWKE